MKIYEITSGRPAVMGILNVTSDSFSDGGDYLNTERAFERACRMAEEGADIIDVGGESTRPGALKVSAAEELDRVIPVIKKINSELDTKISCDTSKAEVAREAAAAGAVILNDVTGFTDPAMRKVAADTDAAICIMHMQGDPETMQNNPVYEDVLAEIREFLNTQAELCAEEGIDPENIIVDPGIGFGKTLEHNLKLLANIESVSSGYPVLVGASRKSFLGMLMKESRPPDKRLAGSLAVASYTAVKGVSILRVHDVLETREALDVIQNIMERENG
jgi:dihydropteroate synthase